MARTSFQPPTAGGRRARKLVRAGTSFQLSHQTAPFRARAGRPLPRFSLSGAVVVVAVAGVAGCTVGPAQPNGVSSPPPPTSAIKLRAGGVATVAVPYLPTNFNPSTSAGANEVTQMVMEGVWPPAVVVDPSFNTAASTYFATSELTSTAPQTVTYKIDAAAVWSDGKPITASDFVYNWHEQLANAGSQPFSASTAGYSDIASIAGSEKGRVVTVVFRRPYADWEALFAGMAPAHVGLRIGWTGFDQAHLADVVSAGPFRIASEVPGRVLVLRRNRRWWGTPAHLNEIVFRVVHGGTAMLSGLRDGSVNVGIVPTGSGVAAASAASPGLATSTVLSPVLWQLAFNLGDPLVGQKFVRRALALSLDRTQLVDDTMGLLDPGVPVAENRLFMENAPGADLGPSPNSRTDLLQARAFFRAAGYTADSSGYLSKGGVPLVLKVTVPEGNALIPRLEGVLQSELLQAGVRVAFTGVPTPKLVGTVLQAGTFQAAVVPYYMPVYQSWTDSVYGAGGAAAPYSPSADYVTSNVARLSDGAIQTLYQEAAQQLYLPTARGLYNEINTLLWNELPTIPLFEQPVTLVTARNLENVSMSPSWAGPMWNAQDWGYAANLPKPTTATH